MRNLITTCLLLISICSGAQHIKFKTFDISTGLSSNSIVDIENDNNGGLWIATINGLNYYDGFNFKVFKNDIENSNSIPNNYILKLKKDRYGTIWILTQDKKICRYIGNNKFENFKFNHKVDDLLVSDSENILIKSSNISYEFIEGRFEVSDSKITTKNTTALKELLLIKHPNVIINTILKDKAGNIWYATRKSGLYIIPNTNANINNNRIDHYTHDIYSNYSFKSNEIDVLHEDTFGNIWLGHKDGGLSMGYPNSEQIISISHHPEKFPNIPKETVRAITKDYKGNIWLGYYTKGLFFYEKETNSFTKFNLKEADENSNWNRIRALFTDSNGNIWVGTYAGLICIQKNKYTLYDAKVINGFPNNRNYAICEDNSKNIWIACWGGIAKFSLKTHKFVTYNGQELLSKYNVRDLKIIENELVIATENNGVVLLDIHNKAIYTIKKENGILGNSIYSVYRDPDTQYYWIASLGGISIYKKEEGIILNLTEKNGLPSNLIYSITNNDHKIWVSTPKGIGIINKTNFKTTSLNLDEGWQSFEFAEGAHYQDNKGVLFYGGVNGLIYFKPSSINFKKQLPRIKVTIDGNDFFHKKKEKNYAHNTINIKLTPIIFPKSKYVQLLYKLKGFDNSWRTLNSPKQINYSNLPSGSYNFLVKKNNTSKIEEIISLVVLKPFYKKTWFYILLFCSLFLICSFIAYKRTINIKKYNKILEEQINKRTQEIKNQKENLLIKNNLLDEKNKEILLQKEKLLQLHNDLKNESFEIEKFKNFITTEFKTPITEVIQTIQKIPDTNIMKNSLLNQSKKIINRLTEWSYLDNIKDIGTYKETSINIHPVLKDFIDKQTTILQNYEINLTCEISSKISWIEIDVLRFKLLLQYLFHDIIKYSNAKSSLNIHVTYDNDIIKISINSSSSVLKDNWYKIQHYSPYYKAVKVLLKDLNAHLTSNKEAVLFETMITVPAKKIDTDISIIQTMSLKYLDLKKEILLNKKENILVYSNSNNFEVANQLLNNNEYNIFFEDGIDHIASALKTIKTAVLVLYQPDFNSKLVQLLNRFSEIPIIYISESIDNSLQEQYLELGIDMVLQLPFSKSLIDKKISKLIKKHTVNDNLTKEVFQVLMQEKNIITPNEKLLNKALKLIKEHLHDNSFNIEKLISILEISKIKCYRLFKETLNQSPSDVLIKLRLEKACHLLKTQNLNISEISFECGYKDPKYFSRLFKKYYDVSPKVYREHNYITVH